jgi:hypothetical protein
MSTYHVLKSGRQVGEIDFELLDDWTVLQPEKTIFFEVKRQEIYELNIYLDITTSLIVRKLAYLYVHFPARV